MPASRAARAHRATRRIVGSVAVRVGVNRFVIVENRWRQYGYLLATTAGLVAIWAAVTQKQDDPGVRAIAAIPFALVWLFFAWRWLPWTGRVEVDADLGTCRVVWRFGLAPLRRDEFELAGGKLASGQGMLEYEKLVPAQQTSGSEAAGCLLSLILGPILGALLSSSRQEKRTTYELHTGLVLRRPYEPDVLLMAVSDLASLEDALAVMRQLAPELVD